MDNGYWYLASPYSKFPGGLAQAHRQVCIEVGRLVQAGVAVFSAIAHSHKVAEYCKINPRAHEIWIPLDQALMASAKGLIVLTLPGWERSIGVGFEISYFEATKQPIVYMMPGTVPGGVLE